MHKITLYEYLAYSDPDTQQAVMDLIRSKGYVINPRNDAELANNIVSFVGYEGDTGLEELAMLHPDRELILRTASKKVSADGLTTTTPAATPTMVRDMPASGHPTRQSDNSIIASTPIIAGLMGIVVLGIVAIIVKG